MAVKVEMPEIEAEAASNEELLKEVKEMRKDFRQLQETLDLLVGKMMADVQQENLQLRHEVQRLHGSAGGGSVPYVPGGNSELLDQVLSQSLPPEMGASQAEDTPLANVPAGPAPEYKVVQEWGRSPEAAKSLGDKVSTLKGIVAAVPAGAERGGLEQLGRDLRAKFDSYDNINFEIFDDENAAKQYAERQVSNPEHRVLSVSKQKSSGRDVILVFQGGKQYEVAP
jgi:hypothetical protein